jgi:hypothetical protein
MLGARRLLVVIPSRYDLFCQVAKFFARVEVEEIRRVDFGDAVLMTHDLSSQLQSVAVA